MDDRSGRGEQISARKQQQSPRPQRDELRKQQNGRDQIVDCKRGLITRNERRNRGKPHSGKWYGNGEQHCGDGDNGQSRNAIPACRRYGREKDVGVVAGLHCRLLQTGIERATKFASNLDGKALLDNKTFGGTSYPVDMSIDQKTLPCLPCRQNKGTQRGDGIVRGRADRNQL
jgi:hypothetical protein